MSTRSAIGTEDENGQIKAVYCHFDGYLSGVGLTLLKSYNDIEKIQELISLGGISSLGDEIGEKHDFDKCPKNVTNFYGRDRDEEGMEAKTFDSRADMINWFDDSEFYYVFTEGRWLYSKGRNFMELKEEICND
jgi:hypothetical protein